jgi:hypothetical protein
VLIIFAAAGGLVVMVFRNPPPAAVQPLDDPGDLPRIEDLCGSVALGGMPRIQVRGDTTLLIMDLDGSIYTMPQANLFLTRALELSGCRLDSTVEREGGGLTFHGAYPDGRLLRLELKPVGVE